VDKWACKRSAAKDRLNHRRAAVRDGGKSVNSSNVKE
jgi:hypothetical protein